MDTQVVKVTPIDQPGTNAVWINVAQVVKLVESDQGTQIEFARPRFGYNPVQGQTHTLMVKEKPGRIVPTNQR